MGFDGDSDSEDEHDLGLRRRVIDNEPITTEELLDGLPLWLDRLFEGSTQRYYISYWPEFPVLTSNFRTRHNNDANQEHSQHHFRHQNQSQSYQPHRHMHED